MSCEHEWPCSADRSFCYLERLSADWCCGDSGDCECRDAVTCHSDGVMLSSYTRKLRHPSSERFHQILVEHGAMHDQKQEDYGTDEDPFANVRASEEFGVDAWVSALIRLNDKIVRLKSMIRKGYLANEPVEDSLRDIAVYATIALVLYEERDRGAG